MFSFKIFFIVPHIEIFVSHFFFVYYKWPDSHEKHLKITRGLQFIFGFSLLRLCPSYTGINKML